MNVSFKSQSATAKKILFLFLIPPKVSRSGESELCEQNEEQKQKSDDWITDWINDLGFWHD